MLNINKLPPHLPGRRGHELAVRLYSAICSPRTLGVCICLWVAFQAVYVAFMYRHEMIPDPGTYIINAETAIKYGYNWYPNHTTYHDAYIFNPGIVNLIIFWKLHIGGERTIPFLFILLNLVTLLMGFDLCRRLHHRPWHALWVRVFADGDTVGDAHPQSGLQ